MEIDDKFFISVEGIDGSGTTTITEDLYKHLEADVKTTHEPFMPDYDKLIDESVEYGHPLETFFAFQADRAEHIRFINEDMDCEVLVSDRYKHSTMAYQAALISQDEVPGGNIRQYMEGVMDVFPDPDVVVFADATPEECVGRMSGEDRYENPELLEEVYSNYKVYLREWYEGDVIWADTSDQYDLDYLLDRLRYYGVGT